MLAPVVPIESKESPAPVICNAYTLLSNFKPIETIIDGLPTGRGALVTITAPTGHGKTTVATLLQIALCRGLKFAGRDVTQGSVLALAGENPDDYIMHLKATAQDLGLCEADLMRPAPMGQLYVIPGTFNVLYEIDVLKEQLKLHGEVAAVFVDTAAAFYMGDDENSNVGMRRHASALRELTTLAGKPTVFVLCHPTKNATRENLLPRGGGAFLAEVDANLTLWKDESGIVTLHWCGKIRGSTFAPIRFELVPVELEGFKDCRGKAINSVVARHVPDGLAEQLQKKAPDDTGVMLLAMQRKPGGSVGELASACGWTGGNGQPLKSRADRRLRTLKEQGLAEQDRGGQWRLTTKGKAEADRLL